MISWTSITLAKVRKILEVSKASSSSGSDSLHAVRAARSELPGPDFEEPGSVWSLLQDTKKGPNPDDLRRVNVVRQAQRSIMTMRRKPTVAPYKFYLTIDTACENTVVGSCYIESYLLHLKEHGLMPLQEPENEQYCFGPGDPKTSTVRLSIPAGIGGAPVIIRTSLIDEEEGAANKIPFLAGQDWLVMMGAVIDLGNNQLSLPLIDKVVPIFVDYSGHLVIEVDNYPGGGWPAGLETKIDKYPGAIFTVTANKGDASPVSPPAKRRKGSAPFDISVDNPNYQYEPNDDSLHDPKVTPCANRGPCFVKPDYWEYLTNLGIVIRRHCRPRHGFYAIDEFVGGPDPQSLREERLTRVNGGPEIWDMWPSKTDCPDHLNFWCGQTCFFLKESEADVLKLSHKLPDMSDQHGAFAKFGNEDNCFWKQVDPKSLSPLDHLKRVLQFDLGSETPMFEHAEPGKRLQFQIPADQFGSRTSNATADADSKPSAKAQQARASAGMGTHRDSHGHDDDGNAPLAQPQQRGQGAQASLSSSDGLHGGDPAAGAATDDPSHFATFDDSSTGSDQEGAADTIPLVPGGLPPRRGVSQTTGQRQGKIPRMCPMRSGDEGLGQGLHGADHEGDSARLCDHSRRSRSPRRKSTTRPSKFSGFLGQLGRMLLTIIAASACTSDQNSTANSSCLPDFFEEELYDVTTSWRIPPTSSADTGRPVEVGLGASGDGSGLGGRPMKPGVRKRLKHSARRALQTSQAARDVVAQRAATSRWPKRHFRHDIVEIFGGTSMISIRAVKGWGLRVLQPIDIRYGIDLRSRAARRWLMQKLDKWNPRLAVVEFPCTFWSILQSNVNYKDRPEELEILQEAERPFIRLVKEIFVDQRRRGGHALAENPATASSWKEPEIEDLRREYFETTSCMCQFGMVGKNGYPMLKRVRWLAADPIFIDYLNRQCHREHEHEKVAGSNTALSAQYPPELADAIIRAYLDVVKKEDFGVHHEWQVMEARHVNYVDVNRDKEIWRPLLAQAEDVLSRKVGNSCFLDLTSDLYQKIMPLVPWQIMNIQVSYLPKAKRIRPGLENCHRCSVLLQNDERIVIETEHLPTAQAPRERFVTPVKVAIFVLGHAPGEPQEPAPAPVDHRIQPLPDGEVVVDPLEEPVQEALSQQGLGRQDYASGECWFIGPALRHEQRRPAPALVRMHRNLGHPRNEDFVRALAQHGKVDPEAVALARRLRCASCERTKKPLPPRPTSLKAVGSFNDRVCLDFVFIHDANQVKHNFLHILDPAGGFNVFVWVPSRRPDVVFDAFTTSWASWAGYPRSAWMDQDGGFEAEFAEGLRQAGTEIDTSAAEAHWQNGQVESYNRAFRFVANKLIDERQFVGEEQMKMMGALVSASMNDKIRTCGASPNQWLFGKSPRMPEDILSPDGQLEALQGLDHDQQLRLRTFVRAQADVLLSQYRIDGALRKAVLRQGRPTRLSYEPGELVAFWRQIKKKKGKILQPGWFRGTIVGPHKGDNSPGQSNYWVTSGGRLILVSKEQLRPTYGTERWKIQEGELQQLIDQFPEEYYDETAEPPEEEMIAPAHAEEEGEVVVPMYSPADSVSYAPSSPASSPDTVVSSVTPVGTDTTQPPTTRAPGTPVQGLFPPVPRGSGRLPDADLPPVPDDGELGEDDHAEGLEPDLKRARLHSVDDPPDNLYPENDNLPTYEEEMEARASSALWGVRVQTPNGSRMVAATRKEMKALEKELPWEAIPEEQRPGYEAALQKEWDTWKKYQAVEPLDLEASAWVEQNVDPARILPTRVCYRNKNAAYPWLPVKEKARLVCRGDKDPDILSLRRDAPTLTRLSLMVILQTAASFADWFLFNSDITGAFLQGDQSLSSRREPLIPSTTSRRTTWIGARAADVGRAWNLWFGKFSAPLLATSSRHFVANGICAKHFGPSLVHVLQEQQAGTCHGSSCG